MTVANMNQNHTEVMNIAPYRSRRTLKLRAATSHRWRHPPTNQKPHVSTVSDGKLNKTVTFTNLPKTRAYSQHDPWHDPRQNPRISITTPQADDHKPSDHNEQDPRVGLAMPPSDDDKLMSGTQRSRRRSSQPPLSLPLQRVISRTLSVEGCQNGSEKYWREHHRCDICIEPLFLPFVPIIKL